MINFYHEKCGADFVLRGLTPISPIPEVRAAFNGVQVMEWREADRSRIKEGPIGVQLHAWTGPLEVQYKDIAIETFPKQDRLIAIGGLAK